MPRQVRLTTKPSMMSLCDIWRVDHIGDLIRVDLKDDLLVDFFSIGFVSSWHMES